MIPSYQDKRSLYPPPPSAPAAAVRNCPWVGELWCRYLRALERAGAVDEQHALIFQEALAAGLQVGLG